MTVFGTRITLKRCKTSAGKLLGLDHVGSDAWIELRHLMGQPGRKGAVQAGQCDARWG
jgi:hypothetical protein